MKKSTKAPHGPPTRPSAQSEAVPPSVPAVPTTGSAQATWVGRSAASAHLGRASHPPPSSGREQRTSAATRAEAEPAAPAKAPLLSRGHRHRRITPSAAQQRLDWPRHLLAKLKPARPAPQRWRSARAACVYGRARGCTARARAWPPSPACLTPSGARSRCPLSRAAGAWRPAATPPAPRAESVIRCAAPRGWVAWALECPFPGPRDAYNAASWQHGARITVDRLEWRSQLGQSRRRRM